MTTVKKKNIFRNRKKRRIATALIVAVPLLFVCFFGYKIYSQAKSIMAMATGSNDAVSNRYKIESMNYVLRNNATEYQMELFTELKNMVENPDENTTQEDIAMAVAKNHVADFYTWSNKVGQYDVGGLYYINEDGRENVYSQARDTFYQYLNEYINKYGVENLLEVDSVEATVTKSNEKYPITDSKVVYLGNDVWDEEFYTVNYTAYDVKCTWTYKENELFSTKKYPVSSMYKVIFNEEKGRFEIVMAGKTLQMPKTEEVKEVSNND